MKKVSFDPNVQIHHMFVWQFAYREARRGDFYRIMFHKFRFEIRKQLLEAQLDKIGYFSRK